MDLANWHGLTPAFILEVLRQKSAKHLATRELRATLLPECSEPALLISNSGGAVTLCQRDGVAYPQDALRIPPNTILLVQITEKYRPIRVDDEGEDVLQRIAGSSSHTDVIYLLDAAWLNGDNVAHLPYDVRYAAMRKFCTAINKHKTQSTRSGELQGQPKRTHHSEMRFGLKFVDQNSEDQNEFICAEPMTLRELSERNFNLYRHRGCKIAAVEAVGTSGKPFLIKCQAVRFFKYLKHRWTVQWSEGQQKSYYYDKLTNCNTFEEDRLQYSSFYESVTAKSLEEGTSIWKWVYGARDPNHNTGVESVLGANGSGSGDTDRPSMNSIREALSHERTSSQCRDE